MEKTIVPWISDKTENENDSIGKTIGIAMYVANNKEEMFEVLDRIDIITCRNCGHKLMIPSQRGIPLYEKFQRKFPKCSKCGFIDK